MHPLYLFIAAGALALGVWHLGLALQAIFVFRAGEPLVSWISIIAGPVCTLPAAVLALFSRRWGGFCLSGSAVISFAAFVVGERGMSENVTQFLVRISIPMIVAGVLLLWIHNRPQRI